MRNVLVTGGSRGLGLEIARTLAAGGDRVIAVARRPSEALQAAIEAAGESAGRIEFRPFDLLDTAAIPHLVSELRKEFGGIYGLVNNAGLGTSGVLAIMPDNQIEQLVRLNTVAPLVLTKYLVRAMMADGGGRIVNIASVVAFTGYSGLAAYSATKASLIGLTRSLAREVGPLGINVNAVAPGFVETEMTRDLKDAQRDQIARRSALRRLVGAEEVADAVAFLLSDKAGGVTGTVLTVDAGNTA